MFNINNNVNISKHNDSLSMKAIEPEDTTDINSL